MLSMSCVYHPFASVHCCTERADLLALVCYVKLCFFTSPCGILGHVLYLIVSIPDLCHLSYFAQKCVYATRDVFVFSFENTCMQVYSLFININLISFYSVGTELIAIYFVI